MSSDFIEHLYLRFPNAVHLIFSSPSPFFVYGTMNVDLNRGSECGCKCNCGSESVEIKQLGVIIAIYLFICFCFGRFYLSTNIRRKTISISISI